MSHHISESPTLRERIDSHVTEDETVETVCYKECGGELKGETEQWHKYDSMASVPNIHLDGWEELVVFTPQYVYRWVEVGYNSGPTKVPRSPQSLSPER